LQNSKVPQDVNIADIVGLLIHEDVCERHNMIKFVCQNSAGGSLITISGNGEEGKEFHTPLVKLCKAKAMINLKIHIEDTFISHDVRL
jgi:hypothetical protein